MNAENVVLIGASEKSERYAYKALGMLLDHNHNVFPVNPYGGEALGMKFITTLTDITENIDTITLYVAPERLKAMIPDMIALHPKRIIFNPGTEDENLIKELKDAGISVMEACTLVMLTTGQF